MAAQTLFEAEVISRDVCRQECLAPLKAWAAQFAQRGWTPSYGPGDHGNMSCRLRGDGFIITARETVKADLRPDQFVEVVAVEERKNVPLIRCRGPLLPSTDALLHWRLYRARPDVGAILHGHDSATLAFAQELKLPVTAVSAKTPSLELIDQAVKLGASSEYLLLLDHGFLALGRSIQQAGELACQWSEQAASGKEAKPGWGKPA